jgi:erythromycin esterase
VKIRTRATLGLAVAVLGASLSTGTTSADEPPQRKDPVTRWLDHNAHVLRGVDPAAPDADLAPLGRAASDAGIVGLGEAEHGLAEITGLKDRSLRYLVEHEGFRSIAWEEDWSLGTRINDYILGRRDDRDALVGQMTDTWSTQEVADVLTWLRGYNAGHRDKVRFFGVEYYATRPFAYDDVESYVAAAAPGRLPRARKHLAAIRPFTNDTGAYLRWFMEEVADKTAYVRHARKLHDLVASIPHRPGDRRHAIAEHAARQIQSWYVAFSIQGDNSTFRDARAAENLRWWQRLSGDKVVYWAASAHTADAPHVRMSSPSFEVSFASVGSYLRDWYGDGYLSVGFTFDHGSVDTEPGQSVDLPAAAPSWFEHPLGAVSARQFLVDLRGPAPRPVRAWLSSPMVTRGFPEGGYDSTTTGGTPGEWFDLLVHRQRVTTATALPSAS